jgi:hypothetical protein
VGEPDENTCRQIAERTDDGEGLLFSLSRNVVNAKQAYRTYIYIVIDGAGTLHAMADRLKALADDYERRGRKAGHSESAKALTSLDRRGAESRPRAARSS